MVDCDHRSIGMGHIMYFGGGVRKENEVYKQSIGARGCQGVM